MMVGDNGRGQSQSWEHVTELGPCVTLDLSLITEFGPRTVHAHKHSHQRRSVNLWDVWALLWSIIMFALWVRMRTPDTHDQRMWTVRLLRWRHRHEEGHVRVELPDNRGNYHDCASNKYTYIYIYMFMSVISAWGIVFQKENLVCNVRGREQQQQQ